MLRGLCHSAREPEEGPVETIVILQGPDYRVYYISLGACRGVVLWRICSSGRFEHGLRGWMWVLIQATSFGVLFRIWSSAGDAPKRPAIWSRTKGSCLEPRMATRKVATNRHRPTGNLLCGTSNLITARGALRASGASLCVTVMPA